MTVFIGVDVGGTFTDFSVSLPGEHREIVYKVPSTPADPDRAIVAGLRELFAQHGIAAGSVVRLAHGTTVGTNALIQRRVGKVAVVTTEGFRDLLEIRRQTRPKVYDIHMDHSVVLVPRELRIEVRERMRADGQVHVPLHEKSVEAAARKLAKEAVNCVAVCFLHAHAYPKHEQRAARILRRVLGKNVAVITSSSVYPEFREYERFSTTVLNGALLTVMDAYLARFSRAVGALGVKAAPTISQSAGGLMSIGMARRSPIRSALSGPAAGALGASYRARTAGFADVITLDVGGTSADVALLTRGEPDLVHSRTLAGFPLRLPALDVNSVGAGGGSIAWIDRDGLLKIGPHSAGAVPGPACYDLGGTEATVTDANVLLGRLNSEALLDGRMKIRADLAAAAVDRLAKRIRLDRLETAFGMVRLVAAIMVKAIRTISIERGHDPGRFALFAFGGAGPLHGSEVARELGISRVIIPPNPGILCAEGLLNSDLVADFVQTALALFSATSLARINRVGNALTARARQWFQREQVAPADRRADWSTDLRYAGQNFELSIPCPAAPLAARDLDEIAGRFHTAHEQAYGFKQVGEPIEFVSLRVKLLGVLEKPELAKLAPRAPGKPIHTRRVAIAKDAWRDAPVYRRLDLAPGQQFEGPAIIEQMDCTTPLFPGDRMRVDDWGNLVVDLAKGA
ncbi:MAG: hydantoinase/oxoprolinase family protein [Planctomycetota bacterium]|nr:hydantoinase/oxoprolinase family protein [Planctomycetota bacterium]